MSLQMPAPDPNSSQMIDKSGLRVAEVLTRFIDGDVLPPLGMEPVRFWAGVSDIFARFTPQNRELLARRDNLQAQIDAWHQARAGQPHDGGAYAAFLREIGYLVAEPQPFQIDARDVDDELARLAGPQLVVPILNARFLLNAANARWGSLYDALYGTDVIAQDGPPAKGYDAQRGAQVVAYAKAFLDRTVPLAAGSHRDVVGWSAPGGQLTPALADPSAFVGYRGD